MKKIAIITLSAIGIIFLCIYAFFCGEKKEIYYIPQIQTYIHIHKPLLDKYGYVCFSNDSILPFSEKKDFVKIYKSEISSIDLIFDSTNKTKFYLIDRWNNAQINQNSLEIVKISKEDTAFFEQENIGGLHMQTLKPAYFELTIDGLLDSVTCIGTEMAIEYPIKIEKIK